MSILLIHPPFAPPTPTYLSVPTLTAFLRQQGHRVAAWDANNTFFHRLFQVQSLRELVEHAQRRQQDLMEKTDKLSPGEARLLESALAGAQQLGERLFSLADMSTAADPETRLDIMETAMNLLSVKHYPEQLLFQRSSNSISHHSPANAFSSRQSIEAAQKPGILSDFFERELSERYAAAPPRIIGISLSFAEQTQAAFRSARAARTLFPEAFIVLGGQFVAGNMRAMTNTDLFAWVDALALGDGETILDQLVSELEQPEPRLDRVPGLLRCQAGRLCAAPPAPQMDLETLPAPDFSDFPSAQYFQDPSRAILPMRLSRGCYWHACAFCRCTLDSVRQWQQPPAQVAFDRLREVMQRTGARAFVFVDECVSAELLADFCTLLLEHKLAVQWCIQLRFSPELTLERCLLFRKAGCSHVTLGLESYHEATLKRMHKGIAPEMVDRVLSNLSWAGLRALIYMIVGFPGETEEEAWLSFHRLDAWRKQGMDMRVHYSPFQVLPDAPVALHPTRYGLTAIHYPADCDLGPPALGYEGNCMSPGQAVSLAARFNRLFFQQKNLTGISVK